MVIAGSDGAVYKNEVHYLLNLAQNGPELLKRELNRYLTNHPGIQPHQLVSHMLSDRKALQRVNDTDEKYANIENMNANKE